MLQALIETWFHWVHDWGYWGVIILMAMESSIFPVPSELVVPPAAILASQGGDMTILGVMNASVPSWWANPLEGRLDTYVASIGTVAIETVVHQTVQVGEALRFSAR